MGIENIEYLINVDTTPAFIQVQAAQLQVALIAAHRRGEHPYGSMIRACPLCQRE